MDFFVHDGEVQKPEDSSEKTYSSGFLLEVRNESNKGAGVQPFLTKNIYFPKREFII